MCYLTSKSKWKLEGHDLEWRPKGCSLIIRIHICAHQCAGVFQLLRLSYDFLSQSGMNVDKQILQLSQRRDKLVPKLEEILCRVRSPNYRTKVPAHVRQQMDNKVSTGQSGAGKLLWVIYNWLFIIGNWSEQWKSLYFWISFLSIMPHYKKTRKQNNIFVNFLTYHNLLWSKQIFLVCTILL